MKMTIKQVYKQILSHARYHRDQSLILRAKAEKLKSDDYHDSADTQDMYATCYYECALLLEQTEEINPANTLGKDIQSEVE